MDEHTRDVVMNAVKEDADVVMRLLLESSFWPQSIKPNQAYNRFEDDSRRGFIGVTFTPDSDGWIQVISEPDRDDRNFILRFRTSFGGGQSFRVRKALGILAEAIRLDNEEHPQHRSEE